METKSFKQFIDNALEKGADKIEIMRSNCHCGIVKPNDIISVIAFKNGNRYRMSLTNVFDDQPILSCSINGGDYVKQFLYQR